MDFDPQMIEEKNAQELTRLIFKYEAQVNRSKRLTIYLNLNFFGLGKQDGAISKHEMEKVRTVSRNAYRFQ